MLYRLERCFCLNFVDVVILFVNFFFVSVEVDEIYFSFFLVSVEVNDICKRFFNAKLVFNG